jgi:hypothetical protein
VNYLNAVIDRIEEDKAILLIGPKIMKLLSRVKCCMMRLRKVIKSRYL